MMFLKVFVATLIRKYTLTVNKSMAIDEIKLKAHILLAPIKPFKIKIKKRN